MADIADVEIALTTLVASTIFPGVSYAHGASIASVPAGMTVRIYRGWPEATQLKLDIAAGISNVTIFPENGTERNVTRYFTDPVAIAPPAQTVTATVSGATITIGGTVTTGSVVGVAFGPPGATQWVAYAALAGDTVSTIAAALGALAGAATVSVVGAVLTLNTADAVTAAVSSLQATAQEVERTERAFRVSCWCPSPAARDAVGSIIRLGIASLTNANGLQTQFMAIGPFETGHIRHRNNYVLDNPSRDRIYRRDELYSIEYATTIFAYAPQTKFGGGTLTVTH